ncbi:MAG TPA: sulfotransferase [Bacillota bacterium]|nr:sulfotransferase [Bacillota bacterium]
MRELKRADSAAGTTGWRAFGDGVSRRLWGLESKALCGAACRRAGRKEFGDPALEPALPRLLRSLETEADLHPLGRFLMRLHLRDLLATRLRLVKAWSDLGPALEHQVIQRPVFITGMPRSGSTFLHELLATDPDHRSPRVWEVMFPVGAPEASPRARERRFRQAARCLWWFRRLAPQADSAYPMRADTPHECVAIHSYTFLSQEFVSTCRIPSYEAFLRATTLRPVYAWQKRFLQYLQRGAPAQRWILKSPDHVYGLEEIFAVFPDACIIQTHRNPLEVLTSSIHLTDVLQRLYARPGDRDEIRRHEVRLLAEAMESFIRFRDRHPELADRFIDVRYADLVAEPLAVVRRIYQRLDQPLTQVAAERIAHLVASRSRYRRRHASSLAELGVDLAAEGRRFHRYCFRFGIPCQPIELG